MKKIKQQDKIISKIFSIFKDKYFLILPLFLGYYTLIFTSIFTLSNLIIRSMADLQPIAQETFKKVQVTQSAALLNLSEQQELITKGTILKETLIEIIFYIVLICLFISLIRTIRDLLTSTFLSSKQYNFKVYIIQFFITFTSFILTLISFFLLAKYNLYNQKTVLPIIIAIVVLISTISTSFKLLLTHKGKDFTIRGSKNILQISKLFIMNVLMIILNIIVIGIIALITYIITSFSIYYIILPICIFVCYFSILEIFRILKSIQLLERHK